jgi:hypothetical protein
MTRLDRPGGVRPDRPLLGKTAGGIWTDEALARLAGLLPVAGASDGADRRTRRARSL